MNITSTTSLTPEQNFREKADLGDVTAMVSIYDSYQKEHDTPLNICGVDPSDGLTAAHQAAKKGHASVLRLLFNLGDPFTCADPTGKTPAQYEVNEECKIVFDLIALGKKASDASKHVFPGTVDVVCSEQKDLANLQKFRAEVKESVNRNVAPFMKFLSDSVVKEGLRVTDCLPWLMCLTSYLTYTIDLYATLKIAKEKGYAAGACDEKSSVSYVYLTKEINDRYPVEKVQINNGNEFKFATHSFVIINRSQSIDIDVWKKALIVDAFQERVFFCEHLQHVTNLLFDRTSLMENKGCIVACSTVPTFNQPLAQFTSTMVKFAKVKSKLENEAISALSKFGV